MKRRMSVEEEWKSRVAARKDRERASQAKGSCGLPPANYSRTRTGSVATVKPRTTTGKHHAN